MNNSLDSRSSYIKSKLADDIKAKCADLWIKECVSYFVTENPAITNDELHSGVKEQFLLAGLESTSNRVIPETFITKREAWTLKDPLLLQMKQILDISEPFYDQWRNLHNQKLDEVIEDSRESKTFKTKKKRMFKLELTDGYKIICAMEMKQIACLNTKLHSGIKILFIPPLQVVNHIMMIKAENVRIIGGEVEELVIQNAYENVLLRLLNKPTTDHPKTNYKEFSVENEKPLPKPTNLVKMQDENHSRPQPMSSELFDEDDIDLAMIDAIEEQERKKSQAAAPVDNRMILDDDDDYMLAQIELEENFLRQANRVEPMDIGYTNPVNIPSTSRAANQQKRKSVDSPDKSSLITKTLRLSNEKPTTFLDSSYPYQIDGKYNLITIDQFVGMTRSDKMTREYAVEATVEKVFKIKASQDGWQLVVEIKDPYSVNRLSIRFVDEIVADFGKRSAKEVHLLRQRIMAGQTQLKMDIANTLEAINSAMQAGPYLMCVKMVYEAPGNFENLITRLFNRTDQTTRLIAAKVFNEKIASLV